MMDVLRPPDLASVEDFQFKYQSKTRIFDSVDGLPNGPCNMLAVASNHGLVFVGTVRRELLVFHLKDVIDHEEENCRCRVIPLPNVPYFIAVNCTNEILCVVLQKNTANVALFYDVKSVSAETPILLQEIIISTNADAVINAIQWNPVIADMIAVCTSDGNLSVYELKQSSFIIQTKPTTARCLCWSPKGKQLVTGNSDSTLSQYKPDLTFVKTIPAPKIFNNQSQCIAIHWITNFQFSVVYSDPSDLDSRPCVTIVNTPKGANASCTNYEDICYSTGNIRPVHYFLQIVSQWGVMMASSSNGIEVGVLGCREQAEWKQWSVNDEARAELPLTSNKQENYPIGIAFDTAAVHQLTYGENEVMPHMPLLHILSHTGLLVTFNVINANPSAPNVCTPADFIVMPDRFLKSLERSGNAPENKTVAPNANNQSSLFEQPSFLAQQGAITSTPVLPKSNSPFALSDASKPQIATNLFATKLSQMQPSVQDKLPASNAFALNANLPQSFSGAQSQPFPISLTQPVAPQQGKPVIPAASSTQRTEQKSAHITPLEYTTKHKPPINATFKEDAIKKVLLKEANDFQMEVYALLLQAYKVDAKIGTSEDIDEINKTMKQLRLELSSICEVSDLRSQVDDLKKDIIHSLSIIADAKAQSSTHELHQVAKLDPVSAKQQTSIKRLLYYVDMQMRQANQVLDQQWETFQNGCRSKLKITGNDLMIKPSLETVYQPLVRQQEILSHQRSVLAALKKALESSGIATKNKPHETLLKVKYTAKKSNEDPLSKLAKNILNLSLEPTDIMTSKYRTVCDNYAKLTPMKLNALRERFVNHRTIKIKPVKVEIPPMSKMYNLHELAEEVIETNNDIIKYEKEPQLKVPQKPVNFSMKVEQKVGTSTPQTFTISQPVATKPQPLSQPKPAELAKPKPIVSTAASAISFSTSFANQIPAQANSIFNKSSLFTALSQPQSQPEPQKTPKPTATFAPATSKSTPDKEVKQSESLFTSKAPSAFTAAVPKNQATITPLSPFQLKTTESVKVSPVITTTSSSFAPTDKKENIVLGQSVGKVSSPVFTSLPASAPMTISTSFTSPITTSIFGTAKTVSSATSIFGAPKTESPAASIFATAKPESSATSIFGTANTESSGTSIFGTAKTESSGTSIFGTAKTESSGTSIFGTAKTESSGTSIFGTSKSESSGISIFGTAKTESPGTSIFATAKTETSTPSIFATAKTETSTPSIFGTAKTESPGTSIFATAKTDTSTPSIFGTAKTESPGTSIFATAKTEASTPSIFGTAKTESSAASIFASKAIAPATVPSTGTNVTQSTGSIFGSLTSQQTSPSSIFGAAAKEATRNAAEEATTPDAGDAAAAVFQSASFFGAASSPASVFKAAPSAPVSEAGSPPPFGAAFGGAGGSPFGAAAGSPFGAPAASGGSLFSAAPFAAKDAFASASFGTPAPQQSIFGGPTGGAFTSTQSSVFGSPAASLFGTAAAQSSPGSIFGSPQTGGSVFGASPVFGSKPLFSQTPVFGSSMPSGGFGSFSSNEEQPTVAQAGFGSPNAFQKIQSGGFGAPPSLGGSPTTAFGAVPAFGSSPLANTGPFGATAPTGFGTPSQQSSTFENLANQNTLTFGNLAQQTPGTTPQPQPFQTSPSFSGWRG